MDVKDEVDEAIRDILRTLGCPTTTSYIQLVRGDKEPEEMITVINNNPLMWIAEIKE
jgi:hypothetical protein